MSIPGQRMASPRLLLGHRLWMRNGPGIKSVGKALIICWCASIADGSGQNGNRRDINRVGCAVTVDTRSVFGSTKRLNKAGNKFGPKGGPDEAYETRFQCWFGCRH